MTYSDKQYNDAITALVNSGVKFCEHIEPDELDKLVIFCLRYYYPTDILSAAGEGVEGNGVAENEALIKAWEDDDCLEFGVKVCDSIIKRAMSLIQSDIEAEMFSGSEDKTDPMQEHIDADNKERATDINAVNNMINTFPWS